MIDQKIQEKLREKYNPDGSLLRNHQLALIDLLDAFDSICKKNDIKYWLSSGTCLGAIRHGGFIPWDDDVDVEMLREDYLRFQSVFQEDENYVLQTYDNDLFYTEPFPKFRSKKGYVSEGEFDNKYTYHGMFMDIFILEYSPKVLAKLCHLSYGSMRHFSFKINRSSIWVYVYRIWKGFNKVLTSFFRCCYLKGNKKTLRHTLGTGLVNNVRLLDEIFPLKNASFEGKEYPVPYDVHHYLQRMFGNYMELPEKLHTHNIINIEEKNCIA